jgi:hypothetical protein
VSTLGERIAGRDSRIFVGRTRQLTLFDKILVGHDPTNVVLVHGVGGIGKSTLLREFARRARQAARPVLSIDGRQLPADPAVVNRVLTRLNTGSSPAVIVDNWDQISSLGSWLRQEALPSLPSDVVVVLAAREAPDPAWTSGGWERVTVDMELTPLSPNEAEALLRALGVEDEARVRRLARWAGGWPLALALATETSGGGERRPGDDLLDRLTRQLMRDEVVGEAGGVLAAATVARTTTAELLSAVLPEHDPAAGFAWLAARSFAEPLGRGLTIHDLVRRVLAEQLRRKSPELERELRQRIVDYLHDKAQREGLSVLLELVQLVDNQQIRWGLGESRGNYWMDELHPGDEASLEAAMLTAGHSDAWPVVRSFVQHDSRHVFVVKGREAGISGIAVSVTPGTAGTVAVTDPVLGPWLGHARTLSPDGNAVLWQTAMALVDDPEGEVQSLLGSGGLLRSGLHNPRYVFLPIDPRHPGAVAFGAAIGAQHVPALDFSLGDFLLECHVADLGPAGVLGAVRDVVYLELGLTPPPPSLVSADAVREALRDLKDPVRLAHSALASVIQETAATTRAERAAMVSDWLRAATDHAFGPSDDEQLRRRVIELTYWAANGNHTATARALHVSRATHFRRLSEATQRISIWLSDNPWSVD